MIIVNKSGKHCRNIVYTGCFFLCIFVLYFFFAISQHFPISSVPVDVEIIRCWFSLTVKGWCYQIPAASDFHFATISQESVPWVRATKAHQRISSNDMTWVIHKMNSVQREWWSVQSLDPCATYSHVCPLLQTGTTQVVYISGCKSGYRCTGDFPTIAQHTASVA